MYVLNEIKIIHSNLGKNLIDRELSGNTRVIIKFCQGNRYKIVTRILITMRNTGISLNSIKNCVFKALFQHPPIECSKHRAKGNKLHLHSKRMQMVGVNLNDIKA